MKPCALLLALCLTLSAAEPMRTAYPAVAALVASARTATKATPRVPLTELASTSDRTPNFVRALQLLPKAQAPMRELFDAVVYQGAIEPEVKLAMALRIAQIYESPYLAIHANRLLQSTERGRTLLKLVDTKPVHQPGTPEALALSYVERLTQDIHGVSDDQFRQVRTRYNDGQVVELTITTCYFNYLVRMVEALRLPVEPWALEPATAGEFRGEQPIARVNLISDAQIAAVDAMVRRVKEQDKSPNSLGVGFANSLRAMLQSPAAGSAWINYGQAVREYATVDRPLKLHVSFAVSMVNGCRYCTLHQVAGLRRAGVSISKLVAMKKDDSALSPRELTAVEFARKLTLQPRQITEADYARLRQEFGEQGALEVTLQTCNFAYMNRFTDGLRLPSEDEAVHVYQETYGTH